MVGMEWNRNRQQLVGIQVGVGGRGTADKDGADPGAAAA